MQKAFYLLAPMLALPSLYPLARILPAPAVPMALIALAALLYAAITQTRRNRPNSSFLTPNSFNTPWPTCLLIIALSLGAIFVHQPIPTFLPTGWNLLIRPLCHLGLLPLLTPLTLAFTVFTLRTTNHPWLQINRFTLALFTCTLMWPDGAADLPALGLLILSLTVLLTRQRIHWLELCACILLLTCAATARSVFLFLPILMGFTLLAVWPRRAAAVTLGSLAFLSTLNPTLPNFPFFTPEAWPPGAYMAATLLVIVLIQSVYHWRWWPSHQHAAWGLSAPLFVIALTNLSETASFTSWYGAIYLAPALPVLTYTLLRPTYKHT